MADIYTAHFQVNREASDARFEYRTNAILFAKILERADVPVRVVDETAAYHDRENAVIYPDAEEATGE